MPDQQLVNDTPARVGEGLSSGLMTAPLTATAYLVGYGINAMYGTELGTTAKLKTIQGECETIEGSLSAVQSQLATLQQMLAIQGTASDYEGLMNSMLPALSYIDSTWATFTGLVKDGAKPQQLGNLVSSIIGDGMRMQDEIYQIGTTLVTGSADLVGRRGALDTCVDLALLAMQGSPLDEDRAWSWYLYLESVFQNTLQTLHQGMILVVNALVAQACSQAGRKDPQAGRDCVLNQPGTPGTAYLNGAYADLLQTLTLGFRSSVNRFVLGCYDPTAFGPAPAFPAADVLNRIMTRADLLVWLTLRTPGSPADPGILVRRFLRPSQVPGASLTPPGLPARAGTPLAPEPFYDGGPGMPGWFKVVDFTDAACTELAAFEASDVKTLEYHWTWPTRPPAGKPLAASGYFAQVVPRWYDASTLEPADAQGDGTVLFAGYTDASGILEQTLFTSQKGTDPSEAGWGYDVVQQDGYSGTLLASSCSLDGSPHTMACEVAVKGGELDQRMTRQLTYAGQDRTIALVATADYTASVSTVHGTSISGTSAHPTTNSRGPTEVKLTTYTLVNGKEKDKQNFTDVTRIPLDANGDSSGPLAVKTYTGVQLRRGETTVVRFKTCFYSGSDDSQVWCPTVALTVNVAGLRLAWKQPTPNPSAP